MTTSVTPVRPKLIELGMNRALESGKYLATVQWVDGEILRHAIHTENFPHGDLPAAVDRIQGYAHAELRNAGLSIYQRVEKKWGYAERLLETPELIVEKIYGKAGGASSMHRHLRKDNAFLVLSGNLVITPADNPGLGEETYGGTFLPGHQAMAPAGAWHRIQFIGDTVALEIYTPSRPGGTVETDDIERQDEGWAPA